MGYNWHPHAYKRILYELYAPSHQGSVPEGPGMHAMRRFDVSCRPAKREAMSGAEPCKTGNFCHPRAGKRTLYELYAPLHQGLVLARPGVHVKGRFEYRAAL